MEQNKKSIFSSTAVLTFIGMAIGIVLGLTFGPEMSKFKFIGDIWLNAIKLILVPLVLTVIILAVGSQKDIHLLGRVAVRIIIYYVITTIVAALIGLGVGYILKPGQGMSLTGFKVTELTGASNFTIQAFLTGLVSDGMYKTFAESNIIQTMIIAIFLGISTLHIKNDERKQYLLNLLESIRDMIYVYISMVIKMAPVGVLFLMGDSFGRYGFAIFTSMAGLIGTYWLSLIIHILLVYCTVLFFTAGVNPITFIRKSAPVWTFTIASCSSAANIPVGIKTVKENFNVPSRIADFCIPLGAQINYDGTAVLYGCVLMFLCQMYNLPFDFGTVLQVVIVATLISSSGGGMPGSGIIKLMVFVQAFGYPIELVGIVAGFYRFFDMGITTGNCLGDVAGTIAVSKWEEKRAKRRGEHFEGYRDEIKTNAP